DLRDARVLQTSQRRRLLRKALRQLLARQFGLDDFESDTAPWTVLLRLVDGAHASAADNPYEAIASPARSLTHGGIHLHQGLGRRHHHRRQRPGLLPVEAQKRFHFFADRRGDPMLRVELLALRWITISDFAKHGNDVVVHKFLQATRSFRTRSIATPVSAATT